MSSESLYSNTRDRRFFSMVLYGSLIFWTVSGIIHVGADMSILMISTDIIALIISAIMLFRIQSGAEIHWLKKVYCILWIPIFIINWKYQGGMTGSISYAYFSILIIYLGLLETSWRLYLVLFLCLINLVLTLDRDSEIILTINPVTIPAESLAFTYLLHSLIVALIVVFIKVQFDREQADIETENHRLDEINCQLIIKNEALSNQHQQIKNLQNNLAELVHERTLELENKNKELEAYAYDNAHLVRRPLSNILSLIDLLNKESAEKRTAKDQLKTIQKNANELDKVVQKINMILH